MTINPNPSASFTIPVMAGGIPLNINITTGVEAPQPPKAKKKPAKKAKYAFEVTGVKRDGSLISTVHKDYEFPIALEEFESNTLFNGTLWVSQYMKGGFLGERTMLRRKGPKYFNVAK